MPAAVNIEDVIRTEGAYVGTTVGVSMRPMLRNRRDTIVVRPVQGRLQKYDVALYERGDGSYVLHRVTGFAPGGYRILGDNCLNDEFVRESQILGVLQEFWRGNTHCNPHGAFWMVYARIWFALWPVRRLVMRARGVAGCVKRRVLGSSAKAE